MTIIEKIKALLAKAASTDNEHEAEVFLAKAHELMERHQLDANDLEADDPVNHEETYRRKSAATPDWDFMLMFAVARYYGCEAIRIEKARGWAVGLVGRDSARITAIEMHKYLVATVRRLARETVKNDPMKLYKRDKFTGKDYFTGEYLNADQTARRIGNALRSRISALAHKNQPVARPQTTSGKNALVTLDAVSAAMKKYYPNMQPIGGASYRFNDKGADIAAGIGLNRQTGGNVRGQLK